MLLAGSAYDSFTSPTILKEVEEVLEELRFSAPRTQVQTWFDVFVRYSRQVFPEAIPGDDAGAVRGDAADLPVLKTAYAVAVADQEFADVIADARARGGWFVVSENTRHFTPGWNVYGWQFTTAYAFLRYLIAHQR